MRDVIREVLQTHGKLSVSALAVDDHDDLYDRGLTSHACVNVMLSLEDSYDVEFPDRLLRKSTFQSVASIRDALGELGVKSEG